MEKRVYGLETEYGIILPEEEQSVYAFSDLDASYTFSDLDVFLILILKQIQPVRGESGINFFYLNGSKIYRDLGHPEYATPECASIRDLIIWDKAGERIFEETMAEFNENFRQSSPPGSKIYIYKNNRDAEDATFGCHENYLVSRHTNYEYLQKCLIPFLATRQIFCGAGTLELDGFKISQRSRFITRKAENTSTQGRPIINLRDEALANSEKWRRLHLILGDANMSEVSGFLKIGTTALVLRMIEDKFLDSEMIALSDPVASLKAVAADPDCREELRLLRPLIPSGSLFISAAEIQEIYLNRAKEYLDRFDCVDPEWREIIKRWEHVLTCLKDDPEKLLREIDWVAKKWLMESVLEKHDCSWDDFREEISRRERHEIFELLKIIDLQYHDIRRDSGLYNLMANEGIMERLVDEEEIALAKNEPPQDTRARWRCSFFKAARDERLKQFNFQIGSWTKVTATPASGDYNKRKEVSVYYFDNDDPLDSRTLEVDELLAKLKNTV